MKLYLRALSIIYFIGFLFHAADILDLRLKFTQMDEVWRTWIIYLAIADLLAAIGMWKQKKFGVVLFIIIAISQLIAYLGFKGIFGNQNGLVVFHIATLGIYFVLPSKFASVDGFDT